MDKRSLLFSVLLCAAFFAVHTWFGSHESEQTKIYQAKIEQERILKQQALEQEVASRTAKLDEMPLIALFKDAKGEQPIGSAVTIGGHYLTLAWEKNLPSKLFALFGGKFEALDLTSAPEKKEDPAIYSRKSAKKTEVPSLPQDHPVDLQLVSFTGEIKVALGEQRGKETKLPFHYLNEPAIALLKENGTFFPVGIYHPQEKKIRALSDFQQLSSLVQQSKPVTLSPSPSNETFYVLENEYQQLVFSTRGGALAEINLPLKTGKDSKSIVKEIDIDREILAKSPQNARFPLHPFYTAEGKSLNQEGSLGGYYPLLRRPILGSDGSEQSGISPEYYALNIVGDDPELASLNYRVTRLEPNLIQFQASTGQRKITKTFSIPQEKNGPYCFLLDIQIEGDDRNLWLSSGAPDVELVGGSYSPLLRYQILKPNGPDVDTVDLPKKEPSQLKTLRPNWISNCNGFLGLIINPLSELNQGYQAQQVSGTTLPTRLSLVDPGYQLYPPANYPAYITYLPIKSGAPLNFRIFAGPFDDALLKQLDELYDNPLKNYNPEYISAQSIQGWFSFISEPFAKFLFLLMQLFYAITSSWAISIILLTIALKAMMYPLNAWSVRSTLKMQALAPKVAAIKQKFKNDPKRAQLEEMNLYKESGANPLTGCLPMLLQMPFLIGMFYLLKSSFPLRGAPFIPGWIDDLSAPDILFTWGQPIWFFGNEFHLLPILMGASMYLQQKLTTTTPVDPKQMTDAQKQQKMMGYMMPVLMAVLFYSFPSGLNIYSIFSTLLGLGQQWWMTRKGVAPQPLKR